MWSKPTRIQTHLMKSKQFEMILSRANKYFSSEVDCLTLSIHRSSSIFVDADKWLYYIIFIHLRNFENIVLQANKSTHYPLLRENFTFQFKVHTKL